MLKDSGISPHLRRILKSYARYYNETRTHLALDKDAPVLRPVQRTGVVRSLAILGGLHHSTPERKFSAHTSTSERPRRHAHDQADGDARSRLTFGCIRTRMIK
jgi:hypothetical protein